MEIGQIFRLTADPRDLWKVRRLTDKSVWMCRCDSHGEVGDIPRDWQFRIKTVERDFHPA